jgi:hypothetical protein
MAISMRARYIVEQTSIDAANAEAFVIAYPDLTDDDAVWCVEQVQALGRYRPELAQWFADFLMRSREGDWGLDADVMDD